MQKCSALSPRIVGRPASLESSLLYEARSLRSGKPRLPVSLAPCNAARVPCFKHLTNGFVRLGNKISRLRKIGFLWKRNQISRKSWEAGRQQQFTGAGHKVSVKKCRSPRVRRSGQLSEFLLIFGPNTVLLAAKLHTLPSPPICLGGKVRFWNVQNCVKAFCFFFRPHTHLPRSPAPNWAKVSRPSFQ